MNLRSEERKKHLINFPSPSSITIFIMMNAEAWDNFKENAQPLKVGHKASALSSLLSSPAAKPELQLEKE